MKQGCKAEVTSNPKPHMQIYRKTVLQSSTTWRKNSQLSSFFMR